MSQSAIQETVRLKKVLEESSGGNTGFAVEAGGKAPEEVGLSGGTLGQECPGAAGCRVSPCSGGL